MTTKEEITLINKIMNMNEWHTLTMKEACDFFNEVGSDLNVLRMQNNETKKPYAAFVVLTGDQIDRYLDALNEFDDNI